MSYENYDPVFEDYLDMCPYVKRHIADWYHRDRFLIVVELKDGRCDTYDGIEKCVRHYRSLEDLNRPARDEAEWRMRFATNLYRKMRMAGYSQEELAQETNVSVGTISRYMNGDVAPTAYKLTKIAEVLGYDMNSIFDV